MDAQQIGFLVAAVIMAFGVLGAILASDDGPGFFLILFVSLLNSAFWGVIAFVVAHFVIKYW